MRTSIIYAVVSIGIALTQVQSGFAFQDNNRLEGNFVFSTPMENESRLGNQNGLTTKEAIPSRYPFVIARPEDRAWLNNLPIEMRPNRPLHFYGNSVRRIEQSGNSARGFRNRR